MKGAVLDQMGAVVLYGECVIQYGIVCHAGGMTSSSSWRVLCWLGCVPTTMQAEVQWCGIQQAELICRPVDDTPSLHHTC